MNPIDPAALDALRTLLGPGGLRSNDVAGTLDPGITPGNLDAGVVAFPASVEQVAAVVRLCAGHGIPMVPQGGRTGLAGGAVSAPGQLVVSTARLDRILDLDPLAGTAVVEAGVTLGRLQEAAAEHGLSVGIDLAARDSATLGGMVSTNAGGIEAFRHGTTRQRVLGLQAVLPSGEVMDDRKRVTKANEGYDIKQLLIGAEGTLGIVTAIVFSLVPLQPGQGTALVACSGAAEAVSLFRRLRNATGPDLLAAEILWPDFARITARGLGLEALVAFAPGDSVYLLVEVAGDSAEQAADHLERHLADAIEAGEAQDAVLAKNAEERRRMWLIREESWEADKAFPHGFWYDVSVPQGALDGYARALFSSAAGLDPAMKVFLFGHLGDGNMHLTVTTGREMPELHEAVDAAVFAGLAECGGSFSAEHGIGLEKRAHLARRGDPAKLALMRTIKQALDPLGIMNPGKVI
ncbi:MAG: FAD-binding oxidoreductase [Proteobacteria bacterium]|nr:FAD-binding oxidoreductase [Pseudomonadota bacterium]MDA0951847.1 FAD-binding oxidoreductase [Pseudomonadota bacterium]MDA1071647.1 FAD-binding oxidoreductase [Pseudomonadota bacterium]